MQLKVGNTTHQGKITTDDVKNTVIGVSNVINNALANLPPELKTIALVAVGAAIGQRFPKTVMFLAGIYAIGKLLEPHQTTQGV